MRGEEGYMRTLVLAFLLTTATIPCQTARARQGCCSHHGGVCSCQCCDGSPLSAKCAPYYPQCSDTSDKGDANIAPKSEHKSPPTKKSKESGAPSESTHIAPAP